GHTCAPNTCESPSVASMAKCSSSAILPFMRPPKILRHHAMAARNKKAAGRQPIFALRKFGGARGSRTPDLVNAIHALSQLSYGPYRDQWSVVSDQKQN